MIKINLLGDTLAQTAARKSERTDVPVVYAEGEGAAPRASLPIAGAVLGLALASLGGIYYFVLSSRVEAATREQNELQAQKKELAKYTELEKTFQAQKTSLAKKKEVMMGLKNLQALPVHMLEELANCIPDDVWFRELSQKGMTITIRGDSTSFEAINLFRNRLLERRQWFQNVNYPANLPAASRTGRTVEFTISFDLKNSA